MSRRAGPEASPRRPRHARAEATARIGRAPPPSLLWGRTPLSPHRTGDTGLAAVPGRTTPKGRARASCSGTPAQARSLLPAAGP